MWHAAYGHKKNVCALIEKTMGRTKQSDFWKEIRGHKACISQIRCKNKIYKAGTVSLEILEPLKLKKSKREEKLK
jgi:hypothetical protein